MMLASFGKNEDGPNRESFFLILHQSCLGAWVALDALRHGTCFNSMDCGEERVQYLIRSRMARGQHDLGLKK